MLERDSMPLIEDKHSADSADHPAWSSQMYGGDLFAVDELPQSYATHVSLPCSQHCISQLVPPWYSAGMLQIWLSHLSLYKSQMVNCKHVEYKHMGLSAGHPKVWIFTANP